MVVVRKTPPPCLMIWALNSSSRVLPRLCSSASLSHECFSLWKCAFTLCVCVCVHPLVPINDGSGTRPRCVAIETLTYMHLSACMSGFLWQHILFRAHATYPLIRAHITFSFANSSPNMTKEMYWLSHHLPFLVTTTVNAVHRQNGTCIQTSSRH